MRGATAPRRPPRGISGHEERARPGDLPWNLRRGYVPRPEDRVVLAATRRGLAELLGRRPESGAAG
ncbi:hypothetical protein [Streptomyces sp. PT12]|uniref:hypothetical protein n=1 Tax=Streptomyces sp. PT12 TaxID=1510197 RepID=UPI000DE2640C|nr:hypothetical protein [Streptomyces sp. PT12]RBM22435.1 hypothetical protein DEH69_04300 [Streptomyces sp. PT12]